LKIWLRGRRRIQLFDSIKEDKWYPEIKRKAQDRDVWRGRSFPLICHFQQNANGDNDLSLFLYGRLLMDQTLNSWIILYTIIFTLNIIFVFVCAECESNLIFTATQDYCNALIFYTRRNLFHRFVTQKNELIFIIPTEHIVEELT